MAKIDDSVKKKVPGIADLKGFTDEWEQRKLGDEVPNSDGTVSNSEKYTDDLMGAKNAEDL